MKAKKLIALMLFLVFVTSAITSCVGDTTIGIDSIPDLNNTSSEVSEVSEESEPPTEAGYTARPFCTEIINITAERIAIAGTCEEGAVVTIKRGQKDVSVQSVGGYFIAEVLLKDKSENNLEITAKVTDKEESTARNITATYKATVSERPDKFSILIGLNSQLFLKETLHDYNGENLLSTTEIAKFKQMVNDNYDAIQAKRVGDLAVDLAKDVAKPDPEMSDSEYLEFLKTEVMKDYKPVELIYVFVPNAITVYPEYVPEEYQTDTNTTRYKQMVRALNDANVNATVIDMASVLSEHKKDGYDLYNRTNSIWSDYAAFLAYQQLLGVIDDRFPKANARPLSDFNIETKEVYGGDMAGYLYLNRELTKDTTTILSPKTFSFTFQTGNFYVSDVDRALNIDTEDLQAAIQIRRVIKTGKEDLPNVIVYRDETVTPIYNMLAERFSMTAFHTMGALTPRKTDIGLSPYPDYVVVFCSENNLDLVLDSSMN